MIGQNEAYTDWEKYWETDKKNGRSLYNVIAEFYRRFLIRPLLNFFVRKHFSKGQTLLHAGCGSGQVDADIRHYVSLIGMDLSPNALKIYQKENKDLCKTIQGDIFSIPLAHESVDGIYNLGVMEHFTETEIEKILVGFHKVLKPDGKILLLWPPEFGVSVLFFKTLKWLFRVFLKKDVKFHPDEICRLRSKEQAISFLSKTGFEMIDYYFGPRDAFTYAVVVGRKSAT